MEVVGALARLVEPERHVVGQDGEQVDGVERALEELALARRRPQPQHVLEREPRDAGRLEVRQMLVVRQLAVLVTALQRRQRVERQTDRRRHDEQDRDGRKHLRPSTTQSASRPYSVSQPGAYSFHSTGPFSASILARMSAGRASLRGFVEFQLMPVSTVVLYVLWVAVVDP